MNTNEIIVLATSAPPKRPAYRRDLLDCFCYCEGTPVRFTYRKRWIEKKLLNPSIQKPTHALIVFCDLPQTAGEGFSFFLPLRHATFSGFEPKDLVEKADEDAYIAVSFELGAFVNLGPRNIDAKVKEWQQWLLSQDDKYPRPLTHPEAEKAKFVLLARDFPESDLVPQAASWLRLAQRLSSANTLQRCLFYRVEGMSEGHQGEARSVLSKKFNDQPAWYLRSGHQYRLDLQFYIDPSQPAPPATLAPRTSTKSVLLSQPIFRTIGVGRDASVFIKCETVFTGEIGTLVVDDPNDTGATSAQAQFLFVIKPTRGLLLAAITLLALGTLITAIPPEMIRDLSPAGSFANTYATNIAYVLKAVATALVAFGAYLGFKKTPLG